MGDSEIGRRGICGVRVGKQGVFVMLVVVVLWAAIPAFACLLGMPPAQQHSCCSQMEQHCDSAGMDAHGSCCQVHQQNVPFAPAPVYTEHSQNFAIVAQQVAAQVSSVVGGQSSIAFEAPPPRDSLGGSSILRI